MPTRSATVRVILNGKNGRTTYELTHAKVRALGGVDASGRISDATPFATARALTRQGLLEQHGPEWFITKLGKWVSRRAHEKLAAEN